MRILLSLLMVCAVGGIAAAQVPSVLADSLPTAHRHQTAGRELTLAEIEQMALAGNPEIHVAERRLAVVEARVPQAGALEDPMLGYRAWGVPLSQPWNYNSAQNMFMLSQTFPGFGKRGLRTDIAHTDVAGAKADLQNVRLNIQVRVRRAFYDQLRAQDELRIHDEHVAIADQAVVASRIKYTVGQVPQQDILKAQVSLTRLAEHLIHFEQDSEVARSRLNTLLGRDPSTPIGVRGEYSVPDQLPGIVDLEKAALSSRPDLGQAEALVEKSKEEQSLAAKSYTPDFTLSAGYMLMPSTAPTRNNYLIEGSINLPWLNRRKHDAEIAEAKSKTSEQDAELQAMRNAAFGEIQEALAQVKAAKSLADVYHHTLQPQAEASLRSTLIAYENNRTDFLNLLDSQMTVIDIDLAYFQSLADFENRFADLELAVGTPIARSGQGTATPEVMR